MTTAFLLGYLKASAPSIDELANARIEEWIPWIKPIIEKAVIEEKKLLPQETDRTYNLYLLFDSQEILDTAKHIFPIFSNYSKNQMLSFMNYYIFLTNLNEVLVNLNPDEKASDRIKVFVEEEFPVRYEEAWRDVQRNSEGEQ